MAKVLGKQDVVEIFSEQIKKNKKETKAVLDTLLDIIEEELAKGNEINFTGFGKFYTRTISERNGINPKTKEKIVIPSSILPAFKAGTQFKEKVSALAKKKKKNK